MQTSTTTEVIDCERQTSMIARTRPVRAQPGTHTALHAEQQQSQGRKRHELTQHVLVKEHPAPGPLVQVAHHPEPRDEDTEREAGEAAPEGRRPEHVQELPFGIATGEIAPEGIGDEQHESLAGGKPRVLGPGHGDHPQQVQEQEQLVLPDDVEEPGKVDGDQDGRDPVDHDPERLAEGVLIRDDDGDLGGIDDRHVVE